MVQIKEDESFRGPKGPKGPPGPTGKVDIDAIIKQVKSDLKFHVRFPNMHNGQAQEVTVDFSKGTPTLVLPDAMYQLEK